MSEIVGLASQFATQNCLGSYLKLNLGSKFHAEVVTHLPHHLIKLRSIHAARDIDTDLFCDYTSHWNQVYIISLNRNIKCFECVIAYLKETKPKFKADR